MSTRLRYKFFALLFFVGISTWLWGVNYPYVGIYNANNNYLTLAAKNYLRFGFVRLGFLPTYFAGAELPTPPPYYLHHPTLIFPFSAIPFFFFGFHNWVVHVTNFLFLLGCIFAVYKLGAFVWNKRVAVWAAGLAAIFPMTGFFWKYIFFEQGSMFFNLLALYVFIRYLQEQKKSSLYLLFAFTFLSGLIDWGVLYLFIPLLFFLVPPYTRRTIKGIAVYLAAASGSLLLFAAQIALAQHGFGETVHAVQIRAVADELMTLSFWPVRLLFLSLIRTILYFTPFVLLAVWYLSATLWKRLFHLQKIVLISLLAFGLLNIIVLPTATWGHSYFLFYLIPFFSYAGALWFTMHETQENLLLVGVSTIIATSVLVNYFKLEQVRKQFWQYETAVSINTVLLPYEKIGVVNFSGDVFEQYTLHPTQPMTLADIPKWKAGTIYPEIAHIVISRDLREQTAALITRDTIDPLTATISGQPKSESLILKWYRIVRDFFAVGQL